MGEIKYRFSLLEKEALKILLKIAFNSKEFMWNKQYKCDLLSDLSVQDAYKIVEKIVDNTEVIAHE